ncbi:B-cell receptor-associated 31-like [Euphorbia peplus]|nr:B-cell receptor-associated 31-like [Euphorbia peplus]
MISILFCVVFAEMATIITLMFNNPLRKLVIIGIDQLKRGRAPLVAKTVAATLSVVFGAILYSVMQIQKRVIDSGILNSTDEVLIAERLLEASLMGFSLFLAMMTDRVHYYIKELHQLRKELKRSKQDHEKDT